MAHKEVQGEKSGYHDDYEILPHKDLLELRDELHALKQRPSEKTLQISMVELAAKVDKLTDIFEEAMQQIRMEEGGTLSFEEKMRPLNKRMDKVLEQNSQIAEGIVAVADLINELKDELTGSAPKKATPSREPWAPRNEEPLPPMGGMPPMGNMPPPMQQMPPRSAPGPAPGGIPPGGVPPPPSMPPKPKKLF